MSVFSEDIYLNEEDLARQLMDEAYKKLMKEMVKSANIIYKKSKCSSANYIVTGAPIVLEPKKLYVLNCVLN